MGEVKQINDKNRTYYFYNDMINLKNFEPNLLKIDRKSYKKIVIYNIGYIAIKKIDDYEIIYSVNPLYLPVNENGYIEEKNKYLIFDSTDENKEVLKIYREFWSGIKNQRIKCQNTTKLIISEGYDVNKTGLWKECDICHYWYFKDIGFKYEPYLCNGCHNLLQKAMSFNNFAIVYVKGSA